MSKLAKSQAGTVQPSNRGSMEIQKKRLLLAEFLREAGLISNRAVTEELTEIYWKRIEKYELNQVRKGLKEYLETENRFPWPSDLIVYIEEAI